MSKIALIIASLLLFTPSISIAASMADYPELIAPATSNDFLFSWDDSSETGSAKIMFPGLDTQFLNGQGEFVILDLTESDPVFVAWGYDFGDMLNVPSYLTVESDPVFVAWDKDYNDLINQPAIPTNTDEQTALQVPTDTTNFNNNLSAADTDLQKALETLDGISLLVGDMLAANNLSEVDPATARANLDVYSKAEADAADGTVTITQTVGGGSTTEVPSEAAIDGGLAAKQPLNQKLTDITNDIYNNIITPTCVEDAGTNCIASGSEISDADALKADLADLASQVAFESAFFTLPAGGTGGFTISTTAPTTSGEMVLNDTTHVLSISSPTGIIAYDFSASFTAWDTTPIAFTFTDLTDVVAESVSTSDAITVTGINYPSAITVSGSGAYDINASGTFVTSAGTVSLNDTVRARHTNSASASTATNTTVSIGGVSDIFTSTTAVGSSTPEILWETFNTNPGYDNTWVPGGLAMNPDCTTPIIEGTQSLCKEISTNQVASIHTLDTPLAEGYYSMAFRANAVFGEPELLELFDSSDNQIAKIRLWTDATSYYTYYDGNLGSNISFDSSGGGIVYVGIYHKADAANAEYKFWLSSTPLGTNWGTPDDSYSGIASTASVARIRVGLETAIYLNDTSFDAVGVSASEVAWDGL